MKQPGPGPAKYIFNLNDSGDDSSQMPLGLGTLLFTLCKEIGVHSGWQQTLTDHPERPSASAFISNQPLVATELGC